MSTVIGIIGIIVALVLFLVLVYKGWSSYWVAPICALLVAVTNQMNFNEVISSNYIGGIAELIAQLFSIVFLGAMLGKVFSDTGAASAIAKTLIHKFIIGKQGDAQIRIALFVIFLVAALCTMGGIDGYVLTFTIFPICLIIAEMVDIPRRFIPAMCCLNCAFMAAPGAPQINNIIARTALQSAGFSASATAALIPGIVAVIIIAAGSYFTLTHFIIKAKRNGEHFEYGPVDKIIEDPDKKLPNFFVALIPLIAVFVLYTILQVNIFFALAGGIVINLILMGRHLPLKDRKGLDLSLGKSLIQTLNNGANMFPNALLTVVTPSGLAAVITATAAFGFLIGKLSGLNVHYIFLTLIVVCIVVAITSSPPVSLFVGIPVVVGIMAAKGITIDPNAIARVAALASNTFEALPINGLIVLTIGLAKTSHKESYKYQFLMIAVWGFIGALAAALLIYLFPNLA